VLLPSSSHKRRARKGPQIFNTATEIQSDLTNKSPATPHSYWTCLEEGITSRDTSPSAVSPKALRKNDDDDVGVDELDELEDSITSRDTSPSPYAIGNNDNDDIDELDDMLDESDDSADMKEVEDFLLDPNALDSDDD
jgi:hypothetical protein